MPATITRYTTTAITLHWLMALLIVATFSLGVTMTDIPGVTPTKLKYFNWHKWLGVTVLGFATVRAVWRLTHAAPSLPTSVPVWQRHISALTHGLLYLLIFAVPISGYLYSLASGFKVVYLGVLPLPVVMDASPALKPILLAVHYWLNVSLLVLVLLHVAAALKHHFWERDTVLLRMLPWRKS